MKTQIVERQTLKRLGFLTLFAAALALGALFVASTSPSGGVQASEDSAECRTVQVPADDGYGVSAPVSRRICD